MPSIADADGIGTERKYTFKDLVALRVARELREAGVSTHALGRVMDRLRLWKGVENPLAESTLIVSGRDIHWVTGCQQAMSILSKPGQSVFAFMVDLGRTVHEVKRDVQALRAA